MKSSSLALHYAHNLYTNEHKIILGVSREEVLDWRDCVKMGWYFVRFRQWLNKGVVTFTFQKKNGDVREAKGTTNLLLIPREDHPHPMGPESVTPFSAIAFYDLDKRAWRSFSITHFIGFVTVWELTDLAANMPPKGKMRRKNRHTMPDNEQNKKRTKDRKRKPLKEKEAKRKPCGWDIIPKK